MMWCDAGGAGRGGAGWDDFFNENTHTHTSGTGGKVVGEAIGCTLFPHIMLRKQLVYTTSENKVATGIGFTTFSNIMLLKQ